MKLEELFNEWRKDAKIDYSELAKESLRIPELHSKYYQMFCAERMLLKKKQVEYKKLYRQKMEYYEGRLNEDELSELGWEQFDLVVIKKDVPIYIEGDDDVITSLINIQLQQEKVDFLKSIIDNLNSRGYQIKNAIDFLRWSQGNT